MNFNVSVGLVAGFRSKLTGVSPFLRTGEILRRASSIAVAVVLAGLAEVGHASILEFDQIRQGDDVIPTIGGRLVPQDYGDRVSSSPMNVPGGQFTYGNGGEGYTPNVVVDYFTGSATPINPGVKLWAGQYGDLTNVMYGNPSALTLNVRLTADAGFAAQLYGFDLAGWPETDYTIDAVRVLSGPSALFEQTNVLVQGDLNGPRRTSFDFATPLSATELLIEIDYGNLDGGQHDNIGIDNIRFGQNPPAVIPLPAAWLLFFSGLSVLGLFRFSVSHRRRS